MSDDISRGGVYGQPLDNQINGQVDPLQVDPLQVDPLQVDPLQVDPSQVDPSQVDPSQVDPSQVDPSQVDPSQAVPLQVDPLQAVPSQATPTILPGPQVIPNIIWCIVIADTERIKRILKTIGKTNILGGYNDLFQNNTLNAFSPLCGNMVTINVNGQFFAIVYLCVNKGVLEAFKLPAEIEPSNLPSYIFIGEDVINKTTITFSTNMLYSTNKDRIVLPCSKQPSMVGDAFGNKSIAGPDRAATCNWKYYDMLRNICSKKPYLLIEIPFMFLLQRMSNINQQAFNNLLTSNIQQNDIMGLLSKRYTDIMQIASVPSQQLSNGSTQNFSGGKRMSRKTMRKRNMKAHKRKTYKRKTVTLKIRKGYPKRKRTTKKR